MVSHVTGSGAKVSHITFCARWSGKERVSHVKASGDGGPREMVSQGVTCNDFKDKGTRCHMCHM